MKIPFSKASAGSLEKQYLDQLLQGHRFAGDNTYSKKCSEWLRNWTLSESVFMTPSCTDALEMAAILLDLKEGDEVIMPSFTFVSTASAFVLRGATPIFIDIRSDTLNIDEQLIEGAITKNTKAICVVHYAGQCAEMQKICALAEKHKIYVIEDAAQALLSSHHSKPAGSFGHLSAFSFHETKNVHCGEGGCLVIKDRALLEKAHIVYEKGTNRRNFMLGQVDKYSWVGLGSSFLMSEFQAAFLLGQLQKAKEITKGRMQSWTAYRMALEASERSDLFSLPTILDHNNHNAHIFHLRLKNTDLRNNLISQLKEEGIQGTFHYTPLHSSDAGKQFGRFHGIDRHTTAVSSQLLRLPLWNGLSTKEIATISNTIVDFLNESSH